MNIAFLVPSIKNCGPINVVLNIIKSKCFNHGSVFVFAINKSNETEYENIFYNMLEGNLKFLDDYSSPAVSLNKLLINYKIDLVHSHGYYPDKLVSKLKLNIYKISTVHCMFYKDYPKEYGYLKGVLGAFSHFNILRNGDFYQIVGCSDSVADYCKKNNLKNVKSIHNGVDQSRFNIISRDDKNQRKKDFGLEGKVFIYAGRFIRRKRVPELIEYFLSNATDDSMLLLLGDGPEKEQCLESYKSKRLKFIGQVDNPEWYYQLADFVISNSSAEGYPMSIIEAISCGCYALLSDIQPHKELIEDNPLCAKLLDEINFFDLSIPEINRKIVAKLSAENMALKYLKLYEDNK